jgi:hypothetical protein
MTPTLRRRQKDLKFQAREFPFLKTKPKYTPQKKTLT